MPTSVGDPAPDFERVDHRGNLLRLSALRGSWVVVFFYPKDETPGCTAQACAFRDSHQDFSRAGAVVLGISTGTADEHARFAEAKRLPYRLIADDGSIRRAFGVPSTLWLMPGRATYVIDPQGVVRMVFSSAWRFAEHAAAALRAIREASVTASPSAGARVGPEDGPSAG